MSKVAFPTKSPIEYKTEIHCRFSVATMKRLAEIAEATGRGTSSVDRIVKNRKPAQINPEFEAATNEMIAEMRAENVPENDEAFEKRITAEFDADLAAEVAEVEKNSENAKRKSANAEDWRLPISVQEAIDFYIAQVKREIERQEHQIAELQAALAINRKRHKELADFRRNYRAKVDASEVQS